MATHYCGQPYNGPNQHNLPNSQATFMDAYCPELLAKTVFIKNNSFTDVYLQKIKGSVDGYAEWKKKNPGKTNGNLLKNIAKFKEVLKIA